MSVREEGLSRLEREIRSVREGIRSVREENHVG